MSVSAHRKRRTHLQARTHRLTHRYTHNHRHTQTHPTHPHTPHLRPRGRCTSTRSRPTTLKQKRSARSRPSSKSAHTRTLTHTHTHTHTHAHAGAHTSRRSSRCSRARRRTSSSTRCTSSQRCVSTLRVPLEYPHSAQVRGAPVRKGACVCAVSAYALCCAHACALPLHRPLRAQVLPNDMEARHCGGTPGVLAGYSRAHL